MKKSEVYSWRMSLQLKAALEEAARDEEKSLAQLLDEIAQEWLSRLDANAATDSAIEQGRRHSKAMKFVGSIAGGDPNRAANARRCLRARLAGKRSRRVAAS